MMYCNVLLLSSKMKKRSKATQTLRAGCSLEIKADPRTNKQTDMGDYNILRNLARSELRKILMHHAYTTGAPETSIMVYRPSVCLSVCLSAYVSDISQLQYCNRNCAAVIG